MNYEVTCKMIKGPHLLWTGANGYQCFGISVENLDQESIKSGHSDQFNLNEHTILTEIGWQEKLGLSNEEWKKIVDEVTEMTKVNNKINGERLISK